MVHLDPQCRDQDRVDHPPATNAPNVHEVSAMKLHWSSRSPFVRKVMVVAHETGLTDRFERPRMAVAMTRAVPELMRDNPLSKIPTMVLDDGSVLYDSAIICEYLDTLHDGPKMFPAESKARFTALRRQALGDGLLDLLLLWRNERERPPEQISQVFIGAYSAKVEATLDAYEAEIAELEQTPFGIGHISYAVSAAYMDFRFPALPWREGRPRLAAWHAEILARPSFQITEPIDL